LLYRFSKAGTFPSNSRRSIQETAPDSKAEDGAVDALQKINEFNRVDFLDYCPIYQA
jgi:hypothetical protein